MLLLVSLTLLSELADWLDDDVELVLLLDVELLLVDELEVLEVLDDVLLVDELLLLVSSHGPRDHVSASRTLIVTCCLSWPVVRFTASILTPNRSLCVEPEMAPLVVF